MPQLMISLPFSKEIISLHGTMTSPVSGLMTSSAATRPTMRSISFSIGSRSEPIAVTVMPRIFSWRLAKQSCSRMMTS